MAAPADALQQARRAVAAAADALLAHPVTKQLDETLGSKDWRRVRAELFAAAHGAGADWVAALEFVGNIPAAARYTPNLVTADDLTGALQPEMPHVRQRALLAWLVAALPVNSSSALLIKVCEHCGGRLGVLGWADGIPQALMYTPHHTGGW